MSKDLLKLIVIVLIAATIGGIVGGLVGNQPVVEAPVGGSTADNWNVGGNLSVTGTSAFSSDLTVNQSGATSTLNLTGSRGCILLTASNGSTTAFIATSSVSGLVRVASCE